MRPCHEPPTDISAVLQIIVFIGKERLPVIAAAVLLSLRTLLILFTVRFVLPYARIM